MAAPSYDVQTTDVDDIYILGSRRDIDGAAIEPLMESIGRLGLQVPISVRRIEVPDAETGEMVPGFALITGGHRLEACKRLGMRYVPAVVQDMDEIDAELWEISENLHRSDLTTIERSDQIARWIELKATKPFQLEKVSGGRGRRGGLIDAARQLGIGHSEADRAEKIARLTPEAKSAAVELGLQDNQSVLVKAAKCETADAQIAVLHKHLEPKSDDELRFEQIKSLMAAWNKASPEARAEFLARIETPVMDRAA